MSIKDGGRLPHRRILIGSDLMIVGDRMPGKRYNGFIKSEFAQFLNSTQTAISVVPLPVLCW